MIFILFNLILFIASIALVYSGFSHVGLFLELPLSMQILVVIGFITPVMNLYDTIKNFNEILMIRKQPLEAEDED